LKSRIKGAIRVAFSLCPDERQHVERAERFFDEVGSIAERGAMELASSIKRFAELTPTERARLDKMRRFFEELPGVPGSAHHGDVGGERERFQAK
jgi:hypothetical protein